VVEYKGGGSKGIRVMKLPLSAKFFRRGEKVFL